MLDVLDLDGAAAEPGPFDLGGHMRRADDPRAVDAGDGVPPLADLGVFEGQ